VSQVVIGTSLRTTAATASAGSTLRTTGRWQRPKNRPGATSKQRSAMTTQTPSITAIAAASPAARPTSPALVIPATAATVVTTG
jgi:hypothetical protein